ncbi:THO complex subunit 2-like isoform X2 [Saccostrea echinata]|uniref:THO complex subunit 2-like isoform X2 n=1 Tax=Saccostrea echinata TaxID=191078 RepID=UPI002A822239|nr:THO complex subunit 2-like isoform X2 [Saccostrea echinata]
MAAMSRGIDGLKLWEKSGKSEFIKQWSTLKEKNFLIKESKALKNALYQLAWRVIGGQMKVESAISLLEELCESVKELPVAIADAFAILDVELSVSDDNAQRDKFISLVTGCEKMVAASILKERLDQETLESLGLLSSKTQFNQKYVKTKTKLYYKQKKFNLLREESEGYAKLITELNQDITEKITVEQSVENLKSLIGCFDLDPNRVLDILLESFECRPHLENFYVPLFKEYVTERKTLCHILGFKFHFYKDEETPTSLYRVAALLLRHDLIDLETLYGHLLPADAKIKEYHQKEVDEAKAYARKLSVVSLAEKSEESKETETVKVDLYVTNQKLGLTEALLSLGVWGKAKEILDKLPEFFGTVHKQIATGLCNMVHCMMDSLYKDNAGLPRKILKGKLSGDKNLIKNIQEVGSYRALHTEVFPIMRYIGPYASCDPVLLVKFIRLGKCFMTKRQNGGVTPEDDVAYYGFLNILDEVLLPSMSMLPCNCCLSEELWTFLKLFPYELRYRLYGNWKNDTYSQHPKLVRVRADCLERAKYLMKRLSKENVKPSGRQLGKLSHSNPGVLFEYVLSQIQTHDNFIGPVVDSLKYLTSLSYDMLAYCIIDALANPDKSRMKYDDTNISKWLQSLANFAGCICRKYQVDLAGLMQYVANQLKAGKSFDLLLLREVVTKMAGIEISEEITDDQLDAMSGGELLRQEGGYFAQVRNTKKSSTRLKDSLLEHDLALALCILMSQQRDSVIYEESTESHLKLVGKLYDQCQDTLVQFGSFLSMQLSTEEFVKRLPTIDTLITTYHVPADAAFFLCRPQYTYAINSKFDELRKMDKNNKQSGSQLKQQRYIEAAEEVMNPVVELIQPIYNPRVWEDLSATFFVTFWSMSMYDVAVPTNVYDKQIQQLSAQITAIEDNEDLPQSKKKKEKERCSSLIAKLKDEMKKQGDHCSRVMARLKAQRDSWFISRSTKNETITQFLQLCIFPRCCFTASDAVYCAKFIHILHDLKTPNFSTLICCDRIFCDITYTVTNCTENEAHRYGRFLCASLDTIMKWHSSKEIYDKECAAYPGFVTVFRKGTDSVNIADQLDYENYRHVCHKWHFRITKAMVACLESGNYIQIRNALIVLTKILPNYPRIQQFGQALERRVDRLRQDEKGKRPDIYALAMMYSGHLKNKKNSWVQENMFHHKEMKGRKPGSGTVKQESKANGETKPSKENGEGKESSSSKDKKSEKREKSEGKSKSDRKDDDKKDSGSGTKKSSKEKSKDKEKSKEEKSQKEDKSSQKEKGVKRDPEDEGERGQNKENKRSKEEKKEERNPDKMEERIRIKEEPQDWTEKEVKDRKEGHDCGQGDVKVKEEKTDKIKLKRIHSPSETKDREHKDHRGERASSIGAHESRPWRSPERSASKSHDERDTKRRKLESSSASGSKDRDHSETRDRHRKSPSNERERERKDRKRMSLDYPDGASEGETKRRRSVEPQHSHSSSKINGDSDKHHSKRDQSRDRLDGHVKIKVKEEPTDDSQQKSKSKDKSKSKEKTRDKSSSSSKKSKK